MAGKGCGFRTSDKKSQNDQVSKGLEKKGGQKRLASQKGGGRWGGRGERVFKGGNMQAICRKNADPGGGGLRGGRGENGRGGDLPFPELVRPAESAEVKKKKNDRRWLHWGGE